MAAAFLAHHKSVRKHYAYEDYFNEEGLGRLHTEFDSVDVNKSGTITVQEMGKFLGDGFTLLEVKEIFAQADNEGGEHGTGTISFHEYAEWTRKFVGLLPNGQPPANS